MEGTVLLRQERAKLRASLYETRLRMQRLDPRHPGRAVLQAEIEEVSKRLYEIEQLIMPLPARRKAFLADLPQEGVTVQPVGSEGIGAAQPGSSLPLPQTESRCTASRDVIAIRSLDQENVTDWSISLNRPEMPSRSAERRAERSRLAASLKSAGQGVCRAAAGLAAFIAGYVVAMLHAPIRLARFTGRLTAQAAAAAGAGVRRLLVTISRSLGSLAHGAFRIASLVAGWPGRTLSRGLRACAAFIAAFALLVRICAGRLADVLDRAMRASGDGARRTFATASQRFGSFGQRAIRLARGAAAQVAHASGAGAARARSISNRLGSFGKGALRSTGNAMDGVARTSVGRARLAFAAISPRLGSLTRRASRLASRIAVHSAAWAGETMLEAGCVRRATAARLAILARKGADTSGVVAERAKRMLGEGRRRAWTGLQQTAVAMSDAFAASPRTLSQLADRLVDRVGSSAAVQTTALALVNTPALLRGAGRYSSRAASRIGVHLKGARHEAVAALRNAVAAIVFGSILLAVYIAPIVVRIARLARTAFRSGYRHSSAVLSRACAVGFAGGESLMRRGVRHSRRAADYLHPALRAWRSRALAEVRNASSRAAAHWKPLLGRFRH